MSKVPFRFPLGLDALEAFCHPAEGHALSRPIPSPCGAIFAGNGYIAIKAQRGQWLASDFTPSPEALQRLQAFSWDLAEAYADKPLSSFHDLIPTLFRFRSYPVWQPIRHGKRFTPAPCPIVLVAGEWHVRLAHLQLVSRLPRAELLGGIGGHLAFRFSTGTGFIAKDPVLSGKPSETPNPYLRPYDFQILKPDRPHFDGSTVSRKKSTTLEIHAKALNGGKTWHERRASGEWPPPEPKDD